MTATKRVRLSPEARRAQLIELGVDMLGTHRLDELSVELIASTAGISRGLLFHYFASKHEFHVEVARAAADGMMRRTAPVAELAPLDALRASVAAFIDYVQENPENYVALVRGAASGDAELRAIFEHTRTTLAQRILDALGDLGTPLSPAARLAVHGWVAYVEECVIRWLRTSDVTRDDVLAMLTDSLPAVIVAAESVRDSDNADALAALLDDNHGPVARSS